MVVFYIALLATVLDAIKRRLRDINMATLNQLGHLTIKKREEQCSDVRAVHIGIGHDNDAVIAKLGNIKVGADGGAQRSDQCDDLF